MNLKSLRHRKFAAAFALCLACLAIAPALSSAGTFTYVKLQVLQPWQTAYVSSATWQGISVKTSDTNAFCIGTNSSSGASTCTPWWNGSVYIESVLGFPGVPWVTNNTPHVGTFSVYKYVP